MQITLTRPAGSYGVGSTINVPSGVAHLLVKRGWATVEEEGGTSPEAEPQMAPQVMRAKAPTVEEPVVEYEAEAPTPQAMTMSAPTGDAPPAAAPQQDLRGMLKADLTALAQSEGIRLDGSETKADLVTRIERHRSRYARRDMRVSK